MHDLSNCKSYKNLGKWIKEVLCTETFKWKGEEDETPPSSSSFGGYSSSSSIHTMTTKHTLELDLFKGPLPVLIVGTKADLAQNTRGAKPSYGNDEQVERHSIQVVWSFCLLLILLFLFLFFFLFFGVILLLFFSLFHLHSFNLFEIYLI